LPELFARYERRSGRDLSRLDWYSAMAAWKLAVLYDYSLRQGRDPYYADPDKPARFISAGYRFAGLA
jgi:aminoglycoside phosphotransferase (APT) family kinase protein